MRIRRKKATLDTLGYKADIGVDRETRLVHHVKVTGATVYDVTVVPELLNSEEVEVFVDSGYLGADNRECAITRTRLERPVDIRAIADHPIV